MRDDRDILEEIDERLRDYKHTFRMLSIKMVTDEISNYPIYILHAEDVDLGKVLLPDDETHLPFSVSISHLEDFVNRGVIEEKGVKGFQQVYKDPGEFLCIFYTLDEKPRFLFIPF
jgi:hypothetical protein